METYPGDEENLESRDPREGMTPEELRTREENLKPLSETVPETVEEIRHRSEEESDLEKARREYGDLQGRAAHDASISETDVQAAKSRLLKLEVQARTKPEDSRTEEGEQP
jgi:hypothetical protein